MRPISSEWLLRRAKPKGTVSLMHTFRTIVLAVSFVTLTSQAFAQVPGSGWPGAPNPATVQMQQNGWPAPDPYQDAYRRGYGYPGGDYTCPQPSVIVGVPAAPAVAAPPSTAPPQVSAQQANSPATTPDANASPAAPV